VEIAYSFSGIAAASTSSYQIELFQIYELRLRLVADLADPPNGTLSANHTSGTARKTLVANAVRPLWQSRKNTWDTGQRCRLGVLSVK
jgi:hypothetical protein